MESKNIFISHSSIDKDKAWSITNDLKNEGLKVWLDRLEIEPSGDFPKEIEKGLDDSAIVLLLWSKDADQSDWVGIEISRAHANKLPIIPIILDETRIHIRLENTQNIDFRNRYHHGMLELIGRLAKLRDESLEHAYLGNSPWEFSRDPAFGSRFLADNNYLVPESSDFAKHSYTRWLNKPPDTHFFTFTAIPYPNPLPYFDLLALANDLKIQHSTNLPQFVGDGTTVPEEGHHAGFNIVNMEKRWHTGKDFFVYRQYHNEPDSNLRPETFLRFHESGSLEYGLGQRYAVIINTLRIWDYMLLVGGFWKFANLAKLVYQQLKYDGEIQLLANCHNTSETYLGNFAKVKGRLRRIDPISQTYVRGVTPCKNTNKNLQIVINLDLAKFNLSNSHLLMQVFSHKLQTMFNMNPSDLHYLDDTKKFDWETFHYGVPL